MNASHLALFGLVFALTSLAGLELGASKREADRGVFAQNTRKLTPTGRGILEAKLTEALGETEWRVGGAKRVEASLLRQLANIPESNAPARTRTLLRLALVSDNPEGQAALFSQICGLRPDVCQPKDGLRNLAIEQVRLRQVSPGDQLPLLLLGAEHPPVGR